MPQPTVKKKAKKPKKNLVRLAHPVGVDVSKDTLDVDFSDTHAHRYANTEEGCAELLAELPEGATLLLESTGPYHRLLVACAHAQQRPVAVVTAAWVSYHAKADGVLDKSDPRDARSLREFGATRLVRLTPPRHEDLHTMAELLTTREALVKVQTQLSNLHQQQTAKAARQALQKALKTLQQCIQALAKALAATATSNPALQPRYAKLLEQFGIAELSAAALLARLPELGHGSRNQIAALAGLAAREHQSGKTEAPRHIRGGRPAVRRLLYQIAFTAKRQPESVLGRFYQGLLGRGKPRKVALIAAARKMLIFLHGLIRQLNLPPLLQTAPAA